MDGKSDVVPCWRCGRQLQASATACSGCGAPNPWERDDLELPTPRQSLLPGVFAGMLAGVATAVLLIELAAVLSALATH